MDPSWRRPVTLVCPRGLGDTVVVARVGEALARTGREVGLRTKGAVQWVEEGLPVPPGVGRPSDDADLIDLCDPPRMTGWQYDRGSRLHHIIARRAGVEPEALTEDPWLRPAPWAGAEEGQYVVIVPEASTVLAGLSAEQMEMLCCVAGVRCVIVNAQPLPDLPTEAEDLTGKTSVAELCSIIGGARAVVAVSTGPLHVAAACRVPLLAVLGPNMNARGFWRDYYPALWLQSQTRPAKVAPSFVGEALSILLDATEQPPQKLERRRQWARRQQARINARCAA